MCVQCYPECIEEIIAFLAPLQRFAIATHLRFSFAQSRCLPVLEFATMEHASAKGQCDLLEKWKTSGLEFMYMDLAVDDGNHFEWRKWPSTTPNWGCYTLASAYGHIAVLEWWKISRIPLYFFHSVTEKMIVRPMLPECIEEIIAFLAPLQRFTIATHLRFSFAQTRCLPVLEFATIEHASAKGQCDLLERWKEKRSGLAMKFSAEAVRLAIWYGRTESLEWWKKSGLVTLVITPRAEMCFPNRGHSSGLWTGLDWCTLNGFTVRYVQQFGLSWVHLNLKCISATTFYPDEMNWWNGLST